MLSFTHRNRKETLSIGGTFISESSAETYRDTPASGLAAVTSRIESGENWKDAVSKHYGARNPWLTRIVTDPCRDLFLRTHPPAAGSLVLDVGAGWGQYSLPLASSCKVASVEPTPERLGFIRAVSRQLGTSGNMYFLGTDFFDITLEAHFDYACCIGVLEWVPKFRAGDPRELQADFLRRIRSSLRSGGILLLGIENRIGLKYVLGAPDDHTGHSLVSVYDAELAAAKFEAIDGARKLRCFTYTHAELRELLEDAGFKELQFYAAYPDYKLPAEIHAFDEAAERHCASSTFVAEHDGYAGNPLSIQDELASHYRSLAKIGIARFFAPSFFVTAIA